MTVKPNQIRIIFNPYVVVRAVYYYTSTVLKELKLVDIRDKTYPVQITSIDTSFVKTVEHNNSIILKPEVALWGPNGESAEELHFVLIKQNARSKTLSLDASLVRRIESVEQLWPEGE